MKSLSTPGALNGVTPENARHPTFHETRLALQLQHGRRLPLAFYGSF
jgi:hypothetical protein